ncbi:hypothetical protein ACN47E_000914 [Coniothyrium glycines]
MSPAMDLNQLDVLCSDLTVAAKTLKTLCDSIGGSPASYDEPAVPEQTSLAAKSPRETDDAVAVAQSNLCGLATRLQTLLAGPTCFIRRMATQNQLLACLKWLGEHQVIAYIPLKDSMSLEELAHLADVPEPTLSRVVRMTATAGFLQEPQLGHVAHTTLSSSFTTDFSYFDAAMFLANKVAPGSLDLASFEHDTDMDSGRMAAVAGAAQAARMYAPRTQEPQLARQWLAYRHSVGSADNDLSSLLTLLNWNSLGKATIVHICDTYTALSHSLALASPAIQVTVQTYDLPGTEDTNTTAAPPAASASASAQHCTTVERRHPASQQPVPDAAVYLVQPSFRAASTAAYTPCALLTAELHAHFRVLQARPSALLILAPALLPEPGSVAVNLEVAARLLDFADRQFGSPGAIEVSELFRLTESVRDAHGGLMVANRLRSADGGTVALVVKYQANANGHGHGHGHVKLARRGELVL